MKTGDCLLLYTDGVCEAVDDHDNEFGLEKLEQVFSKSRGDGGGEGCGVDSAGSIYLCW